ncbi:HIT-like protein [Serendipita vermifera]|nr:HIT-like protein [Serendipita vermifera]
MELVKDFKITRVLNHDPVLHNIALLGETGGHTQAILILKKTAFQPEGVSSLSWDKLESIESNDIYHILLGWLSETRTEADVKVDLICPATETHIKKYTRQHLKLVKETPELYQKVVKPYIDTFPPERTSWIDNILSFKKEAEKILYVDDDFILLPDFKWDLKDVNTLYLQAIVRHRSIKSLRDIRPNHLSMLKQIQAQSYTAVRKWGLKRGDLRLYVHYQPSYCHFHVHVVQVNYSGLSGANVGQAHLLDDIISLLEIDGDREPSIFERMTLSYTVGEHHGLYKGMTAANTGNESDRIGVEEQLNT